MSTSSESDGPAAEPTGDYPRPGCLELVIAIGLIVAALAGW